MVSARSDLAAWKSGEQSSFRPFEATPETDGAATHQQLPGHLGGEAMALRCQSPSTKPKTSFAAVSDAEGHAARDGAAPIKAVQRERIGRCLGQPHHLPFYCIFKSPCDTNIYSKRQRGGGGGHREKKKETIGAEAGE